MRTRRNDEIIADHSVTDMHRSHFITIDTAVTQPASTANTTAIAYPHIPDGTRIKNHHSFPDAPDSRSMFVGIEIRDLFHPADQFRAVAV